MRNPISDVITIRQLLQKEETDFAYVSNKQTEKKTLKEGRKYIIPGYQREISWGPHNMQMLLRDVMAGPKFLGIILLSTNDYEKFDIIDGQQRITSILMVLAGIKEKTESDFEACDLDNRTFDIYSSLLSKGFVVDESEREDVEKRDYLGQLSTFKSLWDCSMEFLNYLKSEDVLLELEEHLLDSSVCVLISEVEPSSNESYRLCVDYFIDINNKSEHLNSIEILKAYAFRENFKNASEKWEVIQKNENKLKSIYYPKEVLFYHYFLCRINEYSDYRVKGISDEYKLNNCVSIGDKTYIKGTDIELLTIGKKTFYKRMMAEIEAFQEFMITIENDKSSPSEKYANYFEKDTDYDTLSTSFTIITGILHNSDVVPKMLLLKYFLFLLYKKEQVKNRMDLLTDINILAVSFSASKTDSKSSATFGRILLNEKWEEALHKVAVKKIDAFIENVGFKKEMTQNKQVTTVSGEYMSRRIIGLLYACSFSEGNWIFDQKKYKTIMDTQGIFNCEHFFFDEGQRYSFMYKGEKIERAFPNNLRNKHIAYIGNYLLINREINEEMGNFIIDYKLDVIKKHMSKNERVFLDDYSKIYYETACSLFSDSYCLKQSKIEEQPTKEDAIAFVENYISNQYVKDMVLFIDKLYENLYKWHALKKNIPFKVHVSDETAASCVIEFVCNNGMGTCRIFDSWPLYMVEGPEVNTWDKVALGEQSKELAFAEMDRTALPNLLSQRKELFGDDDKELVLNEIRNLGKGIPKCIYCLWDVKNKKATPSFYKKKEELLAAFNKRVSADVKDWESMDASSFKKSIKVANSTYYVTPRVENLKKES